MELQRDDRKRVPAGLSEPERQRHVKTARVLTVIDEVSKVELLANHLTESLAWLPREFFPHVEVVAVESVDHLSTYDQAGPADEKLANCVRVVGPGISVFTNPIRIFTRMFVLIIFIVRSISTRVAVGAAGPFGEAREGL